MPAGIMGPGKHPRRFSSVRRFRPAIKFTLTGTTVDAGGNALGGVTVDLFRTGDNSWVARTVSDGSGNFTFTLGDNAGTFFTRTYLAGSPDVAGTSVNTLVAV